jgi:hypothetical protein
LNFWFKTKSSNVKLFIQRLANVKCYHFVVKGGESFDRFKLRIFVKRNKSAK